MLTLTRHCDLSELPLSPGASEEESGNAKRPTQPKPVPKSTTTTEPTRRTRCTRHARKRSLSCSNAPPFCFGRSLELRAICTAPPMTRSSSEGGVESMRDTASLRPRAIVEHRVPSSNHALPHLLQGLRHAHSGSGSSLDLREKACVTAKDSAPPPVPTAGAGSTQIVQMFRSKVAPAALRRSSSQPTDTSSTRGQLDTLTLSSSRIQTRPRTRYHRLSQTQQRSATALRSWKRAVLLISKRTSNTTSLARALDTSRNTALLAPLDDQTPQVEPEPSPNNYD